MPKINGNEVRPSDVIMHQEKLWVAVKVDHVKPGKGGAYAQVELKAIIEGTKLNERFRSAETVKLWPLPALMVGFAPLSVTTKSGSGLRTTRRYTNRSPL